MSGDGRRMQRPEDEKAPPSQRRNGALQTVIHLSSSLPTPQPMPRGDTPSSSLYWLQPVENIKRNSSDITCGTLRKMNESRSWSTRCGDTTRFGDGSNIKFPCDPNTSRAWFRSAGRTGSWFGVHDVLFCAWIHVGVICVSGMLVGRLSFLVLHNGVPQ
jgi:hypothetical protein